MWSENEAIASLSSQLYEDSKDRMELEIAQYIGRPVRPAPNPDNLQRPNTVGWTATRSSDGSWVVNTNTELEPATYRVFESGSPYIRLN